MPNDDPNTPDSGSSSKAQDTVDAEAKAKQKAEIEEAKRQMLEGVKKFKTGVRLPETVPDAQYQESYEGNPFLNLDIELERQLASDQKELASKIDPTFRRKLLKKIREIESNIKKHEASQQADEAGKLKEQLAQLQKEWESPQRFEKPRQEAFKRRILGSIHSLHRDITALKNSHLKLKPKEKNAIAALENLTSDFSAHYIKDILHNENGREGRIKVLKVIKEFRELFDQINQHLAKPETQRLSDEADFLKSFRVKRAAIFTNYLSVEQKVVEEAKGIGARLKEQEAKDNNLFDKIKTQFQNFIVPLASREEVDFFGQQMGRQRDKLKRIINITASEGPWQKADKLIPFFRLISRDNLVIHLRAQAKAMKEAREVYRASGKEVTLVEGELIKTYLEGQGFSRHVIETPLKALADVINTFFEGQEGAALKKSLRKLTAEYDIYADLFKILAHPNQAERQQQFEQLSAAFMGDDEERKAIWVEFFKRPGLDLDRLRQLISQDVPVDPAVLTAFREALKKEHPIFASLNVKLDELQARLQAPSSVVESSTVAPAESMEVREDKNIVLPEEAMPKESPAIVQEPLPSEESTTQALSPEKTETVIPAVAAVSSAKGEQSKPQALEVLLDQVVAFRNSPKNLSDKRRQAFQELITAITNALVIVEGMNFSGEEEKKKKLAAIAAAYNGLFENLKKEHPIENLWQQSTLFGSSRSLRQMGSFSNNSDKDSDIGKRVPLLLKTKSSKR